MNVFEVFGVIGLKAESFFNGLSEAGAALSSFAGKVGVVVDTAKKIDGVITGISDKAVSATTTFVTETFSIAKAIDENIMQVVDRAGETVIGVFQSMTTEGVAFFKDVMQEGIEFDAAMGQVSATMMKSKDEFDELTVSVGEFTGTLTEYAQKLGAETIFTSTQVGEAMNYITLSGRKAQETAELLPHTLDLAAAGTMGLGDASEMVTQAVNALGLEEEDVTRLIDQMAMTSTNSGTTIAQLGDGILAIGATARDLKGGITELNTALGVLADNGIQASEGGNMLRRVLTRLTAGDSATTMMETLGVSAYDAQGNMKGLPDIFMELNQAMAGFTTQQRNSAITEIFGQYSLSGANALLNTTAERWQNLTSAIEDSEGAAAKVAEVQRSTLKGQIQLLDSAYSGVKTNLFSKIAGISKEFVETLSAGLSNVAQEIKEGNFFEAFMELGETAVNLIKKGVTLVLENSSTIDEIIYGAVEFIKKVGSALFEGGSQLLPELLKHLLFFAQGIITNFADFLSDEKNLTTIRETISNIFTQLETFLDKNRDNLYVIFSTLFDLGVEIFEELFLLKRETIYSILSEKLLEIIKVLPEKIKNWLESDGLSETVDNILSFIGELAQTLLDSSAEILPSLLHFVFGIGDKIITGLSDFLSDEENLEKIRGSINLILTELQTFLDEHEDDLYNIFSVVFDVVFGLIGKIFILKRKTTFNLLWTKILEILQPVGDAIWDWIEEWILGLPEKIKTWYDLTDFFEIYHQLGEDNKKKMDDFFKDIQDKTSTWLTKTLPDKIKQWYDLGTLKEAFVNCWQPIIDDAKNWGTDLIQNFIDGISGMKDKVTEKAGEIASVISDFFHHSTPEKGPLANDDEWMPDFMANLADGIEKNRDLVQKATEGVAADIEGAFPKSYDITSSVAQPSIGRPLEIHIGNFYNNTKEDIQELGRELYESIYRKKVSVI